MISQIEPLITSYDVKEVTKYLESGGWVTEHNVTKEFEEAIAKFLGVKHCILTTSGTVAIALAVMAVSNFHFKKNLPFAIPDYTMMGTARAVQLANRNIRLVDIELGTLCMALDQLEAIPSLELCGVVYVSINGRSGNMEQLVDLCMRKDWFLIEDACQSFGSSYKGKFLGTFGDIGCFSLSPHKIITTGQGGIIVTNNDIHAINIRFLKDQGRLSPGVEQYPTVGYNFKYTDLQASLGVSQLKSIEWRMEIKRYIYNLYFKNLNNAGIEMFVPDLPWFVDIYTKNRDMLFNLLKNADIESRKVYPPVHTQYPFSYEIVGQKFPVSDFISKQGLFLPSSITLTDSIIKNICNVINGNDSDAA